MGDLPTYLTRSTPVFRIFIRLRCSRSFHLHHLVHLPTRKWAVCPHLVPHSRLSRQNFVRQTKTTHPHAAIIRPITWWLYKVHLSSYKVFTLQKPHLVCAWVYSLREIERWTRLGELPYLSLLPSPCYAPEPRCDLLEFKWHRSKTTRRDRAVAWTVAWWWYCTLALWISGYTKSHGKEETRLHRRHPLLGHFLGIPLPPSFVPLLFGALGRIGHSRSEE